MARAICWQGCKCTFIDGKNRMIAFEMECFERAGVSHHYGIAANSSVFMSRTISRHSGKFTCIDGENRMKASEPELFSKNLLAGGIMMYEAMAVSTVRKEGKRHTAGPQRRGNLGNEQPYPEALQNTLANSRAW